jgi:flagellar hook-length control protein FliK
LAAWLSQLAGNKESISERSYDEHMAALSANVADEQEDGILAAQLTHMASFSFVNAQLKDTNGTSNQDSLTSSLAYPSEALFQQHAQLAPQKESHSYIQSQRDELLADTKNHSSRFISVGDAFSQSGAMQTDTKQKIRALAQQLLSQVKAIQAQIDSESVPEDGESKTSERSETLLSLTPVRPILEEEVVPVSRATAGRIKPSVNIISALQSIKADLKQLSDLVESSRRPDRTSQVNWSDEIKATFTMGALQEDNQLESSGPTLTQAIAMMTQNGVNRNHTVISSAQLSGVVEGDIAIENAAADTATEDGDASLAQQQRQNIAQNVSSEGVRGSVVAGNITLPIKHPQWGQALAQRVMVLAQNNQQLAQIRLHPAHLGPIQVKLKVEQDAVQVSLHAHHTLTREAIEQALPRMRELFQTQGLTIEDIQVQPDAQSHAQAFADARREQAQSHSGYASMAHGGQDIEETMPETRPVAMRINGLIDQFV